MQMSQWLVLSECYPMPDQSSTCYKTHMISNFKMFQSDMSPAEEVPQFYSDVRRVKPILTLPLKIFLVILIQTARTAVSHKSYTVYLIHNSEKKRHTHNRTGQKLHLPCHLHFLVAYIWQMFFPHIETLNTSNNQKQSFVFLLHCRSSIYVILETMANSR